MKRKTKSVREERQKRAQELIAARALRSPEEQLALLDQRPGNSARERARLLKLIGDRKPTKEERRGNGRKKSKAA